MRDILTLDTITKDKMIIGDIVLVKVPHRVVGSGTEESGSASREVVSVVPVGSPPSQLTCFADQVELVVDEPAAVAVEAEQPS